MTRQQKIKALKAIVAGTPAKYALNPMEYAILQRNQGDTLWQTSNGNLITEKERELYLTNAILFENVSRQFRIEKGKTIEMNW